MTKDIFVPAGLIILLGLLLEPFGMPPMLVTTILILVVAVFALFALFLWKEKGLDEREESHIHKADRFGFIAGALILVIAIVIESIAHMLSPWLVLALAVMISVKAIVLLYTKRNN
jgi:uncharacterized membrane protein